MMRPLAERLSLFSRDAEPMEEVVVTITTYGRTFTVSTERELVSLLFALGLVPESTLYAYFVQLAGV